MIIEPRHCDLYGHSSFNRIEITLVTKALIGMGVPYPFIFDVERLKLALRVSKVLQIELRYEVLFLCWIFRVHNEVLTLARWL
jgi:hypothetical protein